MLLWMLDQPDDRPVDMQEPEYKPGFGPCYRSSHSPELATPPRGLGCGCLMIQHFIKDGPIDFRIYCTSDAVWMPHLSGSTRIKQFIPDDSRTLMSLFTHVMEGNVRKTIWSYVGTFGGLKARLRPEIKDELIKAKSLRDSATQP